MHFLIKYSVLKFSTLSGLLSVLFVSHSSNNWPPPIAYVLMNCTLTKIINDQLLSIGL